jgi:DNA adenine methylase
MVMSSKPLKYHGGKAYLAPWLIRQMPPHTHYLEPYFGSGAVLLAKEYEGVSEAVNDIDARLITFWRVLRSKALYAQLAIFLETTPFSDYSYWEAKQFMDESKDPVELAAGYIVRNRMSRQGLAKSYATPTRRTRRAMNESVASYLSAIEGLPEVHERMQRVEIRQLPAVEFIRERDHAAAFFYCDPPYLASTRSVKSAYAFEMSDAGHAELLEALSQLKGTFMLSGYRSQLYDDFASKHEWRREEISIDNKAASGDTKRKMVECVWMNY